MPSILLWCEDQALPGSATSLLEAAKLSQIQQLAKAGAAGCLTSAQGARRLPWNAPRPARGMDRAAIHRALTGLRTTDANAAPGLWYAARMKCAVAPEDTVWCCDLVTQRDGVVIDSTAGDIPTKESELLIQALEDALGSEHHRWEIGEGRRHLFISRGWDGEAVRSLIAPEQLAGMRWARQLPKTSLGTQLTEWLGRAGQVLDAHPINRVRIDLGENPANAIWLWGPGKPHEGMLPSSLRRTAVMSNDFALRGLAQLANAAWSPTPEQWEEEGLQRLVTQIMDHWDSLDYVYVHLPVVSRDPVDRQCAMERLDQIIIKPLSQRLSSDVGRLALLIDDAPRSSIALVALGEGVTPQPTVSLEAEHLLQSPLRFTDPTALFDWFVPSTETTPLSTT